MGCSGSKGATGRNRKEWSDEDSFETPRLLDEALEIKGGVLSNLEFPLTIADPNLPDCPLIAVSQGFITLTGYTRKECVGANCRFMLSGVPPAMIDHETRFASRAFCTTAVSGSVFRSDKHQTFRKPWWPDHVDDGQVLCVQANAKKNGTIFRNMFFMKQVTLTTKSYILALHMDASSIGITSGEVDAEIDLELGRKAYAELIRNMTVVEQILNKLPFTRKRASAGSPTSPKTNSVDAAKRLAKYPSETSCRSVSPTANGFPAGSAGSGTNPSIDGLGEVPVRTPWDPRRFKRVQSLQRAERNLGEVALYTDTADNSPCAVKLMPLNWVGRCHSEFLSRYPRASEHPWFDICTCARLTEAGFPNVVAFKGVFITADKLQFVQEFANGGDLFDWIVQSQKKRVQERSANSKSGLPLQADEQERLRRHDRFVCLIFRKVLEALQRLHQTARIVHRDLSLENVMLHRPEGASTDSPPDIKLVDFGMARDLTAAEHWVEYDNKRPAVGKVMYTAPELHEPRLSQDQEAVDVYAAGVILYCLLCEDYPWLTSEPGEDEYHDIFLQSGIEYFVNRRRVRGGCVARDMISPEALDVIRDMWAFDPQDRARLTDPTIDARSVWRHAWWWRRRL